jgi:hypothetical protein
MGNMFSQEDETLSPILGEEIWRLIIITTIIIIIIIIITLLTIKRKSSCISVSPRDMVCLGTYG